MAGIALVYCYRLFSHLMTPLFEKHVLRGLLGGIGLGLAGIAAPLVLFSGQYQFQMVLVEGTALGAATLLFLVVVKILASTWCMALETPIPLQEVREQLASFRDKSNFDEALDTLNRNGLLIRPGHNVIKILDNRPVKV